jgi:hypothetical protein
MHIVRNIIYANRYLLRILKNLFSPSIAELFALKPYRHIVSIKSLKKSNLVHI